VDKPSKNPNMLKGKN